MDEHEKRQNTVAVRLIAAYAVLMKTLTALPLPIGLPSLLGSMFTDEVHEALIRAHRVLPDVPMDDTAQEWIGQMILDWIVASDIMFSNDEDPESWKLDFIEVQIARILSTGDLVTELLDS